MKMGMHRSIAVALGILGTALLLSACASNPLTGQNTMALVDNSELFPMAFQQYDEFLADHKVISGTA